VVATHDLERRLMRRMVDGLAGWATYHQAVGAKQLYNEHFFYQPVHDIAVGRHWEVRGQAKIVDSNLRKGPPSTIDFVFFRRPNNQWSRSGIVFVEVKYLRGDNPSQDIAELRKDINKLRHSDISDLEYSAILNHGGSPAKFLIVVGQTNGLTKNMNLRSRSDPGVVKMLRRGMQNPGAAAYAAVGDTYLSEEFDWRALAFGESRWPKEEE
jgi:hypothetical protein